MADSSASDRTNGHRAPEERGLRYRVEWESEQEGIRWADVVHAASVDEALEKSRGRDTWPSNGPNTDVSTFRVVEVSEVSPAAEALHRKNARRRHLNTIIETGLSALGKPAPDRADRADDEAFEILCDFFIRAVVAPGRHPFPFSSEDPEAGRLLRPDDQAAVLAQLLMAQLAHHQVRITRDPEQTA
ncbi:MULTISPECIES: hypothetical protein [unclassified Streptomyces]|uniref:hypothetical protein n=1 Tax=unclassified Streptomyces TaxID=2593676 RepID=UPI000ADFEB83|nr:MULTISPECIES: hypothetical protein [unclassified Streptomyces]AZM58207.1 hypothetical protein DLM49_00390 [Streptomyces sp. WAC 01438]RSM98992.1 hypothetical protein DMA10_07645 [Streptomyces sp. WAC 01420]